MSNELEFLQKYKTKSSPIRVCFCSRSRAGSWEIRGRQMAQMRSNWEAIDCNRSVNVDDFDIFCIVKKIDHILLKKIQKAGKPIVFDIVDSWQQPFHDIIFGNKNLARWLFKKKWKNINANGYIFPNIAMYDDLNMLVPNPTTIYHHHRPSIEVNPIRQSVLKLGYEGGPFLGPWKQRFENICERKGLEFVINPRRLADVDIVVLARGGLHGSFMANRYKSNVKIANAFASGTPALAHSNQASVRETGNDHILFFNDEPGSFERQLDRLIANYPLRASINKAFKKAAKEVSIFHIADQAEEFFKRVAQQPI